LQIGPFFHLQLLPLFPPAAAVQSRRRRSGGPARPRSASRWRPRVELLLLHRPLSRAGAPLPCHAAQSSPPAATSPSRWRARCRGRRPLLACSRALQIPQKLIPLALLLSPRSHAAERRRRSTPYAGKLDAAAEPPHRRSSARSDPLASTAVASRNSQTTSPHPILTGAPPPPFSSAADPPCSVEPPPPSPVAPEVCLGPL